MPARQEEVRGHHHRAGAPRDARVEGRRDRGLRQLHVGGLDDLVGDRLGHLLDHALEHLVALGPPRTVVHDDQPDRLPGHIHAGIVVVRPPEASRLG
jgi:hypothetical protein